MPYLYRHIRLDTNVPFYIGIGGNPIKTPTMDKTKYKRAYEVKGRNPLWNIIVSKTGYEVEILFEDENYDIIKNKEQEFIKLYGRIDLKNGSLANLTNGGDGALVVKKSKKTIELQRKSISEWHSQNVSVWKGKKHSESTKAFYSESRKGEKNSFFGKKHTKESIQKQIDSREKYKKGLHPRATKVIDVVTGVIYDCVPDACEKLNIKYSTLYSYLIGRSPNKTTLEFLYNKNKI